MKSFLSFLLSFIFVLPSSLANTVCEEALTSLVQTQFEESYHGRFSYAPYCCNSNIYWFANKLSIFKLEGADKLIEKSQVLFIYDRRLEKLLPTQNREGIPWWWFHVVLDTPLGIYDLDDILAPGESYQPRSREDYFRNMFFNNPESEELLDELVISKVNASRYLKEFNADHGDRITTVESNFQGWVGAFMRQVFPAEFRGLEDTHGGLNPNEAYTLQLPMMSGDQLNSLYYLLSNEYREISPPVSLREFLSEASLER